MRIEQYVSRHMTFENPAWYRVQALVNECHALQCLHSGWVISLYKGEVTDRRMAKKHIKEIQRKMQKAADEAMRLCGPLY